MKTKKLKALGAMSMVVFIGLSLMANKVHAQEDLSEISEMMPDQSFEMDDMDLEGTKNRKTQAERLADQRQRIEEHTNQKMLKKIEDQRVKKEMELAKKLNEQLFNDMKRMDDVSTQQAAPAQVAPQPVIVAAPTVVEAPAPKEEKAKENKAIISLGAQNIAGEKVDNWKSNVDLGLSVENMVMSQLGVGLSVGYTTLDITDANNAFTNYGYQSSYYNYFGSARTIDMSRWSVGGFGKFYFTDSMKFRPFAGAGVNYNMTSLKYRDSQTGYVYNNINYGNEGYSSSFVSGTVKLGAEINFNETVGLNVDLAMAKGFTSEVSNKAATTNSNPDQQRLENINRDLEDSTVTSFAAGVLINF